MIVKYVLRRVNFPGRIVINDRHVSYTCGRGLENEIVLGSMLISRHHCIFIIQSDGLYIRDLNSSNGIFVNGEKKEKNTKLKQYDKIGIGVPNTNPNQSNFFVYSLHIKRVSSDNGDNIDDIVNDSSDESIKVEPEDVNDNEDNKEEVKKEILKKKRLRESDEDNLSKRQKTEKPSTSDSVPDNPSFKDAKPKLFAEPVPSISFAKPVTNTSCENPVANAISANSVECASSANPVASASSTNPVPSNEIRPIEIDDDDDIQILDVVSPAGSNISLVPNIESSKPENLLKKPQDQILEKKEPHEKRTEVANKKVASSSSVEKVTETPKKPVENVNKRIGHNEADRRECVVKITKIESISRDKPIIVNRNTQIPITKNTQNIESKTKSNKTASLERNNQDTRPLITKKTSTVNSNNNKDEQKLSSTSIKPNKTNGLLQLNSNQDPTSSNSIKSKNCDNPVLKNPTSETIASVKKEVPEKVIRLSDEEVVMVNMIKNNIVFNDSDIPEESSLLQVNNSLSNPSKLVKLKSVKKELTTSYSQIDDIVCLSSEDEDEHIFPCSQLFDSMNEEITIKEEQKTADDDKSIESQSDDVIVLSDSDEDDNPWFTRLYNSQVYRPSQEFIIKNEPDEEVKETNADEEFGLQSLYLQYGKENLEEFDPEALKTNQIAEAEDHDDDIWDETIQSQQTADQEAESEKDSPQKSKRRKSPPKQQTGKLKQKTVNKKVIISAQENEDEFSDVEADINFIFKDSCEDNDRTEKSKKKKEDKISREVRKASEKDKLRDSKDEKRHKVSDDKKRRKKYADDYEVSKLHEEPSKRLKISEDNEERERIFKESRDRRKTEDYESLRVSMKEKNRQKDENRERYKTSGDSRERKKNFAEIQGKKTEIEQTTRESKKKSEESKEKRFFDNLSNTERERSQTSIAKPHSKHTKSIFQTSKPTESIVQTKSMEKTAQASTSAENLPHASKVSEISSKKKKSWDDELQTIEEKTLAIKAKQAVRKASVASGLQIMEEKTLGIKAKQTVRQASVDSGLQTMEEKTLIIKAKQTVRRKTEVIDALHMSKGQRTSLDKNEEPKTPRKRSVSRNHKLQEKVFKETTQPIEQNHKERIKEKLKEIAMKTASETSENVVPVRKAKGIAKVTHKSRQDSLLFEQQKTATLKPGIAHQRMNNNSNPVNPVAHCSKFTPESTNVFTDKVSFDKRDEKNHTEIESRNKFIRNHTFETWDQEKKHENFVSSAPLRPTEALPRPTETLPRPTEAFPRPTEALPRPIEDLPRPSDENAQSNTISETSKLADVTNKMNIISKTENFKKSRKSCLASFSLDKKRKKKRVTFDTENNKVLEYQIDYRNSLNRVVGKDAPMKRNKSQSEPQMDEYLSRIFNWNPLWLHEQKNLPSEPPVYVGDELYQMRDHYSSFSNYANVLRPLLLLEMWQTLTKESECEEKRAKFRYRFCSVVPNSITENKTSSGEPQTNLLIEVLISKEEFDKDLYPGPGHLLILEYPLIKEDKFENRQTDTKSKFRWIFAYVKSKNHVEVTSTTRFNRELQEVTSDGDILLTLFVLTKSNIKPPTDKISRIRGVMYLKANMREILALQNLQSSPLKSLILTPTIKDYQLPEVYMTEQNPLMTKDTLNDRQFEAVMRISEAVLSENSQISLIHGPPGTGKSKVIVNIVTQILFKNPNAQILVCAPSNAAVDELVLRLLQIRSNLNFKSIKMVRVGRLEAMNPKVKNVSLVELGRKQVEKDYCLNGKDENTSKENNFELQKLDSLLALVEQRIEDIKRNGVKGDLSQLYRRRQQLQSDIKKLKGKGGQRVDFKQLSKDDRNKIHREKEELMLSKAAVIACTLSSCYSGMMEKIFGGKEKIKIPICIVDEATQCCETENLIPLMLGVKKMILVGDTNQLPATIFSKKAKEHGLDQSLFARLQKTFETEKENPVIMLNTQYRMDFPILSWPNSYFYKNQLLDEATVKSVPYSSYRVLNLNSEQDEIRFSNTNEAEFVAKIVYIMVTCDQASSLNETISIGVITPYQNQRHVVLSKIESRLKSVPTNQRNKFLIEVNTVDSFQGQERDVIIMSCVRSSGIGFMSDRQRLCVALTRAKSSLILCGNFKTFQKDEMWSKLLSNARSRGILIDVDVDAKLHEIKGHVLR